MKSWPKPRTLIRKGNFPYKFKIHDDFTYHTEWVLDRAFESEWLTITESGVLTVKANNSGYAWDGCSPKWSILNIIVVGVPDGHVNYRTMKPYTYYASLVHDALYQYLDSVPVKKEAVDDLFLAMLGDFKLRRMYYLGVKYFGGRGVVQKGILK